MADQLPGDGNSAGDNFNLSYSARKTWSPPEYRALKAGAAENGPNFPTADGIEGQS